MKTGNEQRMLSLKSMRNQKSNIDYLKDLREGNESMMESTAIEVILDPEDLKDGKYPIDREVGTRRCGFNLRSTPSRETKAKSHLEKSFDRMQVSTNRSSQPVSPSAVRKHRERETPPATPTKKFQPQSVERKLLSRAVSPSPPAVKRHSRRVLPNIEEMKTSSLLDDDSFPSTKESVQGNDTPKILNRFQACDPLGPIRFDQIKRVSSHVSEYSAPFQLKDDHSIGQNSIDEVQQALKQIEKGLRGGGDSTVTVSAKVYKTLQRVALSLSSDEERKAMLAEISTWHVIPDGPKRFEEEKKNEERGDDGVRVVEPRARQGKSLKYQRKNSTPYARVTSTVSQDASSFSEWMKRSNPRDPLDFGSVATSGTSRVSSVDSKSYHGSWTEFNDPVNTSYFRETSEFDNSSEESGQRRGERVARIRPPPTYENRNRAWWRENASPQRRTPRRPSTSPGTLPVIRHNENAFDTVSLGSIDSFQFGGSNPMNKTMETDATSLSLFMRTGKAVRTNPMDDFMYEGEVGEV